MFTGVLEVGNTLASSFDVNEFGTVYTRTSAFIESILFSSSDVALADIDKIRVFTVFGTQSDTPFTTLPFDLRMGVLRDSEVELAVNISAGTPTNFALVQGAA